MINKNKQIPDGWKFITLSEVGSFRKGKGIRKSDLIPYGINAIRYGEIYTDHQFIIKEIKSFISEKTSKKALPIDIGDIIFAGSGETIDEIGKSVVYNDEDPCYVGGDTIVFTPKNQDSLFLVYVLNIGECRRELRRRGQGQSIVHIYKSELEKLPLILPPLPEQKRIVAVLEKWDKHIEQLDEKIQKKKNIKKGLMQRLLSGELRLPGFSDEWEEQPFNEVFEVLTKPKGLKSSEYDKSGVPVIDQSIDSLVSGYTTKKDLVYSFTENTPVILFGDHSRVLKYIDFKVAFANDGIKLFKSREGVEPLWGFYQLKSLDVPETI